MKEASARCVISSFLWASEAGTCWGTRSQCRVGPHGEKQAEVHPSVPIHHWLRAAPGGDKPLSVLDCAGWGKKVEDCRCIR